MDASDIPFSPTTSAEPLQKKAKDLPGSVLEWYLNFAFFISQEVFFLCDVNFFTSCNNFSDYIVPVQHVLLLVRIFSDMYICSLGNISLHFEFFYVLLNKNLHSEFSIFLSSFLKCITSQNVTFL